MSSPWLLVGLGNPGSRYAKNRHNVGFMAVQAWVERHDSLAANAWRDKWHGHSTALSFRGERVVALLPQTYMNVSGRSVRAACDFLRVEPARLLVVHDELDFEFGRAAIKMGGGHGGHNGLRDIHAQLGTASYPRLRLGIGRPTRGDVADYVLADFAASDAAELPDLLGRACDAIDQVFEHGVARATNAFNTPPAPKSGKTPRASSRGDSSPPPTGRDATSQPITGASASKSSVDASASKSSLTRS